MTDVTETARQREITAEIESRMAEVEEIKARYGQDHEKWPVGQQTRSENLLRGTKALFDEYEAISERARKLETVRAAHEAGGANAEPGFYVNPGTFSGSVGSSRRGAPWRDLGDNIVRNDTAAGLKTRALDAIEYVPDVPKAGREFITGVVESCRDNSAAEFVLATSDPDYLTAFNKVIENPVYGHRTWTNEEVLAAQRAEPYRAAMSLTSANGGYMVPFTLEPSIVLTNSGALNPWRDLASIKTTTTNAWQGVTSAGVTAEWTAEAAQAADASPTVGQIQIFCEKADAYVMGSYEIFGDSDFVTQLPNLIADAKNRLEEAAFATGVGHGSNVPKGVITAAAAASKFTTGTTVATLSSADVFALLAAVPDRFKANASYVMNPTIGLSVRQLGTSLGAAFWANLGDAQPERLLGKPYRESTTMNGTVATGNYIAIAGDFSQFYIVDRLGVQMRYIDVVGWSWPALTDTVF